MRKNPNFHAHLTQAELQAKVAELTIDTSSKARQRLKYLPSEEHLKELFYFRGKEALVCYSWRNALRVFPFIVNAELNAYWKRDAQAHCFSFVRTIFMHKGYFYRKKFEGRIESFDLDAAISEMEYNIDNPSLSDAIAAADCVYDAKLSHYANEDDIVLYAHSTNPRGSFEGLNSLLGAQAIVDFNALVAGILPVELLFSDILGRDRQQPNKNSAAIDSDMALWELQLEKCSEEFVNLGLEFLKQDLETIYGSQRIDDERMKLYSNTNKLEGVQLKDIGRLEAIFSGDGIKVNPQVRIMLVGPGGAGKTSLFQLLTQRKTEKQNGETVAINTAEVDLSIHEKALSKLGKIKLDMTLWDFGGQSVFYNLHRGFMRRHNCVYVLVVDSRHEQAPDDWLAQIEHYAHGDSSQGENTEKPEVLIVTNEYEQVRRYQNKNALQRCFSGLVDSSAFFEFNCTTAQSAEFDDFLQTLVQASINSQKRIMSSTVQGLKRLKKDFANKHSVSITELASYFKKKVTSKAFQREREVLENLGFIVNLKHSKHQENHHYCLDPRWITKVAYQALNHPLLTEKSGLINLDEFRDFVLSEITQSGEKNDVVAFLSVQKVVHSFELNGLSYLFFPDAASAEEPAIIEESLLACHTDKNLVTIECSLPAFPMGLKSFLAIELIENKERLLKFAENPKQSYPAQVEVWRDGLWARFVNGVDIVLFYHVAKQKVEIKCLYPQALAKTDPIKDEREHYWQQFPEFLLSEPLNYLYCLIQLHVNTDVVPVLTDNLDRLDQQRRSAMFHDVKDYKIMQPENSKVIHAKNYFEGKVDNANLNEQNNTANQGGTVNAIQGDNAFQGDGTTQTIDHSQHQFSSISGSFNRTELPALSPLEKQVLFQGIQLFRETHLSAFDKAQQPQLEKIIDEVCEVVESDTAEPKSEQSGKLLKGIWSKIKDVKDAVEIADLLQQGAQWLF